MRMCLLQDYKARKKQRLKKKLVDQLRSSVQQGQAAGLGGLGVGADLQTILDSFGGELSCPEAGFVVSCCEWFNRESFWELRHRQSLPACGEATVCQGECMNNY